MPSKSAVQRRTACAALAIKLGKAKKGANPVADKMAKSMSMVELKKHCLEPVKKG